MRFLLTVIGAAVGAFAGIVLGLGYVELFQVSCFEGYCGYLVFLTFAPLGLLAGAVVCGVLAYRLARRQ